MLNGINTKTLVVWGNEDDVSCKIVSIYFFFVASRINLLINRNSYSLLKVKRIFSSPFQLCLFKGIDHFKENLPNCECYVIKNCGHAIFETHFEESSKAINDWLARQTKESIVSRSQGLKPGMKLR